MAYDTQEERLKVRGSEQITRDLKVNRDLFVSGDAKIGNNDVLTTADKGVSNGVATLDSTGRVPYSQLPESAMEYKGTWDASTNTPALVDGTGTNGDFYVVSVAGTVTFSAGRSVTFYVNDRVIYDGTLHEWERLPAGEVRSVNGQTGDVVLTIPPEVIIDDFIRDGDMNAVSSNAIYDGVTKLILTDTFTQNANFPTSFSVKTFIKYNGKLYVGTSTDGLYMSSDGITFTKNTSFPTSLGVGSVIEYNGKLYVGTGNGIYESSDGETFTQNTSIPTDFILAFAEYNGKLYVGTSSYGLYVSSDGSTFTQNTSFPTSYTVNTLIEYDEKLYVGTKSHGIYVSSDGTTFTQNTSFPKDSYYIVLAFIKYNEKLYVGTRGYGIYISSDGVVFKQNKSFPTSYMAQAFTEYNGKLYVGTYSYGLYVSSDGTTFTQNTSFPTSYTVNALIENNGKLYIGANSYGLYVNDILVSPFIQALVPYLKTIFPTIVDIDAAITQVLNTGF